MWQQIASGIDGFYIGKHVVVSPTMSLMASVILPSLSSPYVTLISLINRGIINDDVDIIVHHHLHIVS